MNKILKNINPKLTLEVMEYIGNQPILMLGVILIVV